MARVPLLLAAILLSGCATLLPGETPSFTVTWRAPDEEGARAHDLSWELVGARTEHGVTTVETTTRGPEGGDFRFTLRYRPGDAPAARLRHDADLSAPGTFSFTYEESPFWTGRAIDGVDAVREGSWVEIARHDPARGRHGGSFHLDFDGACDGCAPRTILDGRFVTG